VNELEYGKLNCHVLGCDEKCEWAHRMLQSLEQRVM